MPVNIADTLTVDTLALATWRSDPQFDYSRELIHSDFSVWDWINEQLSELLGRLLHVAFDSTYSSVVWLLLGFVAVAALVWLIAWKAKGAWRRSAEQPAMDYTVEDDTIHGIDFGLRLATAMSRQEWSKAVRLVYLGTLVLLDDRKRIAWQPSKTPDQYVREWPQPTFRTLSTMFVRVRYGFYPADKAYVERMVQLEKQIEATLSGQEGGAE